MPYVCSCGARFEGTPAAGGEGVPCPSCGAFVGAPAPAAASGLDVVVLASRRDRTRVDFSPSIAGAIAAEWSRSLIRELVVPVFGLVLLGGGITLVFTRLEGHPGLQAACVTLPLVAFLGVLKVLQTPRHVMLHADPDCREPVLHLRREHRFLRARYVFQLPDGRVLGALEKRLMTWWTPRAWTVSRADGTPWVSWETSFDGLGYGTYFGTLGLCFILCSPVVPLMAWALYAGGGAHARYRVSGRDRAWAGTFEIRRPLFARGSARLTVAGAEGRSDEERLVLVGTAAVLRFNPSGAR